MKNGLKHYVKIFQDYYKGMKICSFQSSEKSAYDVFMFML